MYVNQSLHLEFYYDGDDGHLNSSFDDGDPHHLSKLDDGDDLHPHYWIISQVAPHFNSGDDGAKLHDYGAPRDLYAY